MTMIKRAARLTVVLASTLTTPAMADDRDHERHGRRHDCASLAGRSLGGATISTATVVPASATLEGHCKVTGLIAPKLNFELRLPRDWNHKLHYGGGGGYNGAIPPVDAPALNAGYAQVSSDSGHQGSGLDASFALNDPQAAQLFGSLSVPTVMGAATEIVRVHYGSRARRAYFEGCSNGGREALMNVQRFPTLFDGVISRAPAYNWIGLMGAFNRTAKALAAPGGAISTAKIATLASAVRATCDGLDGVVDGVVSNPAACHFDAKTLRCAGGADTGDACLSDPQLNAVTSWISPVSFDGGRYANTGWPLTGNEDSPGAWDFWTTGTPALGGLSLQFLFQDTTVKNYLARDPAANSLTYNFDSDTGALFAMSALNDATNPNLHPFHAAGGKLILWHGGNDSALSVTSTTAYYESVVTAMGGQSNTDEFVRYYTAPGVNHCAGGPGADSADLLTALDRWVSRHRAPRTLTANKFDPATGATLLSRPLCVHPAYPRYTGKGDPNNASSFRCTEP